MFKFFEKLRVPLSYITLLAMIAITLVVGIGQCVAVGTFYIAPFSFIIVIGACFLLYVIGVARKKDFPILVALVVVLFIFFLQPFLNAQFFETIGREFNDNAALGLARILYLTMVIGGVAVLVLYLLEAIFGIKLSFVINLLLLILLGVALLYFTLMFIGTIISLANNNGGAWYELFEPLIPVAGYLFVVVNFSLLEQRTKNI